MNPIFARGPLLGLRLILLLILSMALMGYDHQTHKLQSMRSTLSTIVAPIQYSVNLPFKLAAWLHDSAATHSTLVEENANLKAQMLLLNSQMQKLMDLEKENNQLRALLESSPRTGERMLVAQLLAVNSDPFVHEVVLDQGKKQGVYVGQPVLDASGVMGQVVEVGPLTSRILLITDARSAVPVQNHRTGMRFIATGVPGQDVLRLQHVTDTADVKQGDLLVTSGMGLRYPVGYPVGTVRRVNRDSGQAFVDVLVKPAAYLDRSRQVLLVWPGNEAAVAEAKQQLQQAKVDKENSG